MAWWSIVQVLFIGILVAFPFLWMLSAVFRYHVKFLVYYIIILAICALVIPIAIFRPGDTLNSWYVAFMFNLGVKIYGMELEERQTENLKSDKPIIIVSNHQSSIDLIGMMSLWPDRCTCLAKKELMYAGIFGPACLLCGTVFVDRLNKDRARGTMDKTAKKINDGKLKVWIFPEGTRNRDGNMLPFKKGAFHLAVQAQIPIIPVVFSCYQNFLNKKDGIWNKGKIITTVLPPIETTGLKSEDVTDLTEKIRNQMLKVYEATSEEVGKAAMFDGAAGDAQSQ